MINSNSIITWLDIILKLVAIFIFCAFLFIVYTKYITGY